MKIADAEAFGNELRTRRKGLGYTQACMEKRGK